MYYEDTIRCAFHHWQYDTDGVCIKTRVGDPPPPGACLFKFPTIEKHGLIWAFNGEQPLFDLPDFPYPEDELVMKVEAFSPDLHVDPWVLCCNTPDIQHIKALHSITFDQADPDEEIEWTPYSMLYDFKGRHASGEPIEYRVGIFGTSIFYQSSVFNGRWFGFLAPLGLTATGSSKTYYGLSLPVKLTVTMTPQRSLSSILPWIWKKGCQRRCLRSCRPFISNREH